MTTPKSLDELVKIFNSALFNDNVEFVRVRKDFIDALIADRQRLLDEVETYKKCAYQAQEMAKEICEKLKVCEAKIAELKK